MRYLSSAASLIAGLLIAVLVLITAASVFMRYVMAAPFQWTEELSGLLLIWIVLVGAIACERNDQHLTIDFIVKALPPLLRRAIGMAVGLASISLLLVIAWYAWELGQAAGQKRTQILRISWFWLDLALVVGGIGTAIVTLVHLFRPRAQQ